MAPFQDSLSAAVDNGLETVASLYESYLVCAHRLISLNIKATRQLLDSNLAEMRDLLKLRDLPGLCELESDLARQRTQRAVDYAVSFNELIAASQQEFAALLTRGAGTAADASGRPATSPMAACIEALVDAATRSRDAMLTVARLDAPEPAKTPPSPRRRKPAAARAKPQASSKPDTPGE